MGKYKKLYSDILSGETKNISFEELKVLLFKLGFNARVNGSHFIFYKESVEEIVNIQALESKAKPYQVKQIRVIIVKYRLKLDE